MEDPPREPADREQQRGGGRDRHPRGARRRRDQTAPGPGWSELGPRVNPAPPGAAGRLPDPRPPRGARARRALAERGDLHLLVGLRRGVPGRAGARRGVRTRTRPRPMAVVERAGGAEPLLGNVGGGRTNGSTEERDLVRCVDLAWYARSNQQSSSRQTSIRLGPILIAVVRRRYPARYLLAPATARCSCDLFIFERPSMPSFFASL